MISLRLPPDLEKELSYVAKSIGKTKTDIVKESIEKYLNSINNPKSPYEIGKDLFGKSDGLKDLSMNRKELIKKNIMDKHAKRSNS